MKGTAASPTPVSKASPRVGSQILETQAPPIPNSSDMVTISPTDLWLSACAMKWWSLVKAGNWCKRESSDATSLSASLFSKSGGSSTSPLAMPSIILSRCCMASSDFVGRIVKTMTAKLRIRIMMNIVAMLITRSFPRTDLRVDSHLKQAGGYGNPGDLQFLRKLRPDPGCYELAHHTAAGADPLLFKQEDVLHTHDILVHAGYFRNVRDAPRAVTQAGDLNDHRDGRGNLLPDRLFRQVQVGHQRHGLQARDGVPRTVGVNGGKRAVVAGVHGLEHVERLFAAHLTDDDAVRAHSQSVDHELPRSDGPFAFHVGRAALQAHHVLLFELQFRGVLNGDDALFIGNVAGKDVKQRGLAGAGATGNEHIQPGFHRASQQLQNLGRQS